MNTAKLEVTTMTCTSPIWGKNKVRKTPVQVLVLPREEELDLESAHKVMGMVPFVGAAYEKFKRILAAKPKAPKVSKGYRRKNDGSGKIRPLIELYGEQAMVDVRFHDGIRPMTLASVIEQGLSPCVVEDFSHLEEKAEAEAKTEHADEDEGSYDDYFENALTAIEEDSELGIISPPASPIGFHAMGIPPSAKSVVTHRIGGGLKGKKLALDPVVGRAWSLIGY